MLPAVLLLWQQEPKLQSWWGHSTGKWWSGKQSKLWRSLWGNHHKKKTSKEHKQIPSTDKPCCSMGDLILSDKAMLLMELIIRAFQAHVCILIYLLVFKSEETFCYHFIKILPETTKLSQMKLFFAFATTTIHLVILTRYWLK